MRRKLRELAAVAGDRRGLLALVKRFSAEDAPPDLRAIAVRKLGNHAGTETVDALEDVLRHDPHWRVRAAATVALGNLHDPRARALLEEAASSDEHRRVRENAPFNRDNPMAFPNL